MIKIPEGYRLKFGDVVVAHLVVKFDVDASEDYVHCSVSQSSGSMPIPLKDIQGIHAIKWVAGDKVYLHGISDPPCCIVLAVHDAEVWVSLPSGSTQTFKANDLRPWPEAKAVSEGAQ